MPERPVQTIVPRLPAIPHSWICRGLSPGPIRLARDCLPNLPPHARSVHSSESFGSAWWWDQKHATKRPGTETPDQPSLLARGLPVLPTAWLRSMPGRYHRSNNLPDSWAPRKPHARRYPYDRSCDTSDPTLGREAGRDSFRCFALKMSRADFAIARCRCVQNTSYIFARRGSTPCLVRINRRASAWHVLPYRC